MTLNKDINYYHILGVEQDATEKDIIRGYRKKALTCHPDKNPDNPKAAQLFIELSEALQILTDPAARSALDKVLKAKQAAKLRTQAYDAKRKKFKEDLEQREKAFEDERYAEELNERVKHLRKQGSELLKKQQAEIEKQLREEQLKKKAGAEGEDLSPKLKVKWSASKKDHENGGYNDAVIRELFEKYGHVTLIIISHKRNGLAIVEFANSLQANIALEFEKGLEENPCTVSWVDAPKPVPVEKKEETLGETTPALTETTTSGSTWGSESTSVPVATEEDFETLVLRRLRQAEERKRLAVEIVKEDERTEVDT